MEWKRVTCGIIILKIMKIESIFKSNQSLLGKVCVVFINIYEIETPPSHNGNRGAWDQQKVRWK